MESILGQSNNKISLSSKNNIIYKVSDKFLELIGYRSKDIIGQSLNHLSILLKNDSQKNFQDIKHVQSLYLFAKDDLALDVTVTCERLEKENKKIFYIEENPYSHLKWVLYNFAMIDINSNESMAIYSYPDCIHLKSNQKYQENLISLGYEDGGKVGKCPPFADYLVERIKKGISFREKEISFISKDGSLTYWDISVRVILGPENKRYMVGSFYDVTKQAYRDKILEKQRLELEKAIKVQEEIFINTSHELKTPINLILTTCQLLNIYLENDDLDQMRDKLIHHNKKVIKNCYRLTKIVNNTLDLSKIELGFYNLNLMNYNIVSAVHDIVDSVKEHAEIKKQAIVFDTELEELVTAFDYYKLERVMLNLISNAIKFSTPNNVITIKLVKKDDKVVISVEDHGIGIKEEELDLIFKKFTQLNTSLNRISEGTGIGLSLVKSIIELHGGSVSVSSTLGQGSIFTIELPIGLIEDVKTNPTQTNQENKVENIKLELSDIYT